MPLRDHFRPPVGDDLPWDVLHGAWAHAIAANLNRHHLPPEFPDTFEVKVFRTRRSRRLVAAVELISPSNKARPTARAEFLARCASYLGQGVSLIFLDVVTGRHFHFHNALLDFLGMEEGRMDEEARLYASAFRPVVRETQPYFDLWVQPCEIGQALPTMPLRLIEDLFVPVELERTYRQICEDHCLV